MLSAQGLGKRYGGATALAGASLELHPGEVVGLIGENGAGKSTFIKIMCGLVAPDEGSMTLFGASYRPRNPKEAERLGLAVIHQERHILENLTVRENLTLGREPRKGPFLDSRKADEEARQALSRFGLEISLDQPGALLSNGEKQMVEIARALSQDAPFVIMDEPTSSLSQGETDRLLDLVQELRSRGKGILYVTHRLGELVRIADRIVGLRDGRPAGSLAKEEITPQAMVKLMVGRDVARPEARPSRALEPVLEVKGLVTQASRGKEVSFTVRKGEILGFAGLVGSGRSEAAKAVYGVDPALKGEVKVAGTTLPLGKPRRSIERGLLMAPEDRKGQGVILDMTLEDNIVLPEVPSRGPWVNASACRTRGEEQKASLRIKTESIQSKASSLSGGNQQKVALAKWLALEGKCLILDEPTCGIDVGARADIYELMRGLAEKGWGILMISSDLEEILAMSDRVVVFHDGSPAGEVQGREMTEEKIMSLAVGHG